MGILQDDDLVKGVIIPAGVVLAVWVAAGVLLWKSRAVEPEPPRLTSEEVMSLTGSYGATGEREDGR